MVIFLVIKCSCSIMLMKGLFLCLLGSMLSCCYVKEKCVVKVILWWVLMLFSLLLMIEVFMVILVFLGIVFMMGGLLGMLFMVMVVFLSMCVVEVKIVVFGVYLDMMKILWGDGFWGSWICVMNVWFFFIYSNFLVIGSEVVLWMGKEDGVMFSYLKLWVFILVIFIFVCVMMFVMLVIFLVIVEWSVVYGE